MSPIISVLENQWGLTLENQKAIGNEASTLKGSVQSFTCSEAQHRCRSLKSGWAIPADLLTKLSLLMEVLVGTIFLALIQPSLMLVGTSSDTVQLQC